MLTAAPCFMDIPTTPSENGDSFLEEVIAVIDDCFQPVESLRELDEYLSTDDVFEAVQSLYPSESYDASDIARLLKQVDFKFTAHPSSRLQFVWLIKRR